MCTTIPTKETSNNLKSWGLPWVPEFFFSLAARKSYVAEANFAARNHENIFVTGQKHLSFQDKKFCFRNVFPQVSHMNVINQMERTFPGNLFRKFSLFPQEVILYFGNNVKFAIFLSRLVLLAAITASWPSQANMTATRISWKCLSVDKY